MWIVTRTPWPTLVNLSRTSTITYHQPSKLDTRIRIVATAWDQEITLAECPDGDSARSLMREIAGAIDHGVLVLDLNRGESPPIAE